MARSGRAWLRSVRLSVLRSIAALGVVTSLLVAAIAAPAASAAGTQTPTLWVPLICNLGVVVVDVGAAFTVTVPTSVTPGEQFNLQNAYATIDIPAQASNAAAFAFGNPSQVEGVVSTFDTSMTNAIAPTLVNADTSRVSGGGAWSEPSTDGGVSADPTIGNPTGSPAVVNLVAAAQPPNGDAPSPLDPLINGPSPLAGFPDYPEPPLMGVFSWGPAPVDGSGTDGRPGGNPTTNAYAPAPGTGGGTSLTSGTPDPASGGPIEVTGAAGQDVVVTVGNPGSANLIKIGKSSYEFAVNNDIFFFETTGTEASQWSGDTPVECALDTSSNAVPPPNINDVIVAGGNGIHIPIVPPGGSTPPAVTAVSPTGGPAAGGNTVTVTGSGFASGDTVDFGPSNPGSNVTVASGGASLTATAPPGTGTVDVTVTDPTNGTSATVPTDQYTYALPPPTVTSVSPSSGTVFGGTPVTITGTNFDPTASGDTVDFGGNVVTVTSASTTSLTVTAPPGSAGAVPVTVTTPSGASNAGSYTYVSSPPAVTSIAPSSGSTGGGTFVTITGTGFDPVAAGDTVDFGSSPGTVTSASTTSITVLTPAAAAGAVSVTVATSLGTSGSLTYTYVTPASGTQTVSIWVPLACDLDVVEVHLGTLFTTTVPTSVTPGELFNLQHSYLTFAFPAAAQNGVAFAFGNPNEIEGALTELDLNVTNAIAPTLVNADTSRVSGGGVWAEPGTDGGVAADPNVLAPGASPMALVNLVAAMQPPNADAPNPLDSLINGPSPLAGFTAYPEPPLMGVFSWGPAPMDGSGSAGATAYAPIPGVGGGSTLTSGTPDPITVGPFEVTAAAGQNVVLDLGDPSVFDAIGKQELENVMTNDLFFNETTGSLPGWSADTPITCGVDTTSAAVPSPIPTAVSVSSGISIPLVTPGPGSITAISPTSGPAAGGNAVTITGTGFSPTAANDTVTFGSSKAAVTSASATSLTVTTPPGSGTASVTVTTAGGTSNSVSYTYLAPPPPPVISSISPTSGDSCTAPGGGATVTITGTGFNPIASGDAVAFGSSSATVTSASATSLTVTAPAGTGSVSVTVTTANGTSDAVSFTYVSGPPSITSISPSSGPTAGGTTVTITGNGFCYTSPSSVSVNFGSAKATVTAASYGSLTVISPPGSPGAVAVSLGGAGSSATFTYVAPSNAPVVSRLLPSSGGPFSIVIISGRNLSHASAVTFGGHRTLFLGLTGQLVLALAPPGVSGTVNVQVTTRAGTSATSSADQFTY